MILVRGDYELRLLDLFGPWLASVDTVRIQIRTSYGSLAILSAYCGAVLHYGEFDAHSPVWGPLASRFPRAIIVPGNHEL